MVPRVYGDVTTFGGGLAHGHRNEGSKCTIGAPKTLFGPFQAIAGGAGVRVQKQVCVPKTGLQVQAPLVSFIIFFPKVNFSDVGGGLAGVG